MIDEKLAMLRTRRNNIRRYDRLLKTNLTDFERQFIERRRSEERSAMETLPPPRFLSPFRLAAQAFHQAPTPDHRVQV